MCFFKTESFTFDFASDLVISYLTAAITFLFVGRAPASGSSAGAPKSPDCRRAESSCLAPHHSSCVVHQLLNQQIRISIWAKDKKTVYFQRFYFSQLRKLHLTFCLINYYVFKLFLSTYRKAWCSNKNCETKFKLCHKIKVNESS